MALLSGDIALETGRCFVFRGREILVDSEGRAVGIPSGTPVVDSFTDTVTGFSAAEVGADFVVPSGCRFEVLREFFAASDEETLTLSGRMKSYLNWRSTMKFCPKCGTPLESHQVENALVCPSCGMVHYPRISPCVICVVCRGDEILLLRHVQRNQDIYCCLAGFVEAGESLEHALRREIREEVGIEVDNIRYAGSQGWPFPDQLMLGFYADYKSGDLKLQPDEISEARWFRRDALPLHPQPGSISWNLIHFLPIR